MTSVALNCTRDALVLGDASCGGIRQLLNASHLPAATLITDMSPLEAISAALQQQRAEGRAVLSLHLVAHGEPGAVWVGDQSIDRVALLANAEVLANWGVKEIALWSCHVGADADFIALLEELTGAVVLCSKGSIGASAGQDPRIVQQRSGIPISECTGVSITELFDGWPPLFDLGRSPKRGKRNQRAAVPFSEGDTFFGVDDQNDVWQVNPTFKNDDPESVAPFVKVLRLNDPLFGGTKLTKTYSNGVAFDQDSNFLYFFYKTPYDNSPKNGIVSIKGSDEALKEPDCMGHEGNVECDFNIVWWDFGSYLADPDSAPLWNWLRWPGSESNGFGRVAGNTYSPENAAFYGDSLWYFADGRPSLYKLRIGTDGQTPVAKELVEFRLDLPYSSTSLRYGDIAIKQGEQGPMLYGSQKKGRSSQNKTVDAGIFFVLDLEVLLTLLSQSENLPDQAQSNIESPVILVNEENLESLGLAEPYQQLAKDLVVSPMPQSGTADKKKGLQLAFNQDASKLWAQTYESNQGDEGYAGVYYLIENFGDSAVQASEPLYQAPQWDPDADDNNIDHGFRDLGGAASEQAEAVPPDFAVSGTTHCEEQEKWNGQTAEFRFDVTLDDLAIWSHVFVDNKIDDVIFYGPFVASFDVDSGLASKGAIYEVESIQIPDPDDPSQPVENLSVEDGQVAFEISSALVSPEGAEGDEDGLFSVVAKLQAPEDANLNGDEEVEMKLLLAETGDPQFATSTFNSPEQCFPGSITKIEASAECIEVDFGAEQEAAQFSFDITRQTSDENQTYAYELSAYGINGGEYEVKDAIIQAYDDNNSLVENGVTLSSQSGDDGEGFLNVNGDVQSFDVEISMLGDNFVGEEQLTLSLTNVYTNSNGSDQIIPATEVTGEADLQGTDCVINPIPPTPTPEPTLQPNPQPTPEPTPEPTPTPQPAEGEVESVNGTSACEIDSTRNEKDAVFQFDVSFNPVGASDQVYQYEFSALGNLAESGYRIQDIVFPDDLVVSPSGKASGDLLVPAGMTQFEVDLYLKSKQLLTGNEGIELTISNDASEATGDAILNEDDCAPSEGSVQTVTGIAACEREGFTNQHRATFSFEVTVDPGDLTQIYDYSFKPAGFDGGFTDEQIKVTGIEISMTDGVKVLTPRLPDGQLQVDAGVEAFTIEVAVSSRGTISGDESLEFEIQNAISTASGVANLSALDCESGSTLLDLDGVGYCMTEDGPTTNFKFLYKASFDPGPATLYGYELGIENLSLNADYQINSLQFTDLDGGDVDVALQSDSNAVGSFLVGEDVDDVIVVIDAIAEGDITAQEALTLTIGDPKQGGGVQAGTGKTAEIGSDLDLGDTCAENPTAPQVVSIEAAVDCDPIDAQNALVSRFIYDVDLIPDNSGTKIYQYSFVPSGFQGNPDAYDVSVVPSDLYVSDDLAAGELQGTLEVDEGVSDLTLEIEIQTGENRVESESLTFSLADEDSSAEATASLQTSDCIEQAPDSHLYLLMNNSTSMLSPDPTTQQSSIPNSLEAQNRIAFASFERAAAAAGYGFRNVNDDSFESFGEGSREAILNNSTKSLAKTLQDYELVDDPNDGLRAGALVVHLITYGYIVDYRREDILSSGFGAGGSLGLNLAQRILLTSTPNELFGNSIDENPKWSAYGLPDPTERDYFPRDWQELGLNASNLYSGTEMLGAFKGLTHLLQEERQDGDLQSDESIFITMATDGRPERRPWWDRRDKKDEGLAIPLPEELGGDEITAAGLLYNNDGGWQYNRDNDGLKQWPKMRKQLNRQINRIAKTFDQPSEQMIVDVVGLGEDSDIDFPAIYDNLFNEQTFDKTGSTWTYNVMNHENLPDFLD